jgi:hypothetical protein
MRSIASVVIVGLVLAFVSSSNAAPPAESGEKPTAKPKLDTNWHVLVADSLRRTRSRLRALPENAPIKPLSDFELTGPKPGDSFQLGNFVTDGKWGIQDGGVVRIDGRNAALKLGRAENFELEGNIELGEEGGWFLLVGWDEGRGYSIMNIGFRESPSPWFITEYRGSAAITDAHQEVAKHAWRNEQALSLTVKQQELNLKVGKVSVLKQQMLPNYAEGDIILGVYDTKYGPRPLRIRSMRIRNIATD